MVVAQAPSCAPSTEGVERVDMAFREQVPFEALDPFNPFVAVKYAEAW